VCFATSGCTLFTLPYTEYEWEKTEQVPIQLPNIARNLSDAKKIIKKNFFPWTSEIFPFIRFENHMDGPRYLKKNLGYAIKYLSIWYFMIHSTFTAGSVLKFGFVT
jgi:hypothetical protein